MNPSQDNSFGSFGNNFVPQGQGAISSGTGDIVLTSGVEKKKRWPIIVLVFLVLAIVGAGVAVFFALARPSDEIVAEKQSSYEGKFNLYLNYLLYGEKSNREVDDLDIDNIYAIDEKYGDEDYMKELMSLYNDFYEAQIADEAGLYPAISFFSVRERIEFLIEYNQLDPIDIEVLKKYFADGEDVAMSYIEDFYGDYSSENPIIMAVKKDNTARALYYIEYWKTGDISQELIDIDSFLQGVVSNSIILIKKQGKELNNAMKGIVNEDRNEKEN